MKKNKSTLWEVLSVVFATILALLIVLETVVASYYKQIDGFLSVKRSSVEGLDDSIVFFAADEDKNTAAKYLNAASDFCEELEAEGLVLLKNDDNALPVSKGSRVSVFGMGSVYINCSSQGMRNASDKTVYPTLKSALEAAGLNVNPELWDVYASSTTYGGSLNNINEMPWSEIPSSVTESFGDYSDAAIFVVTRDSIEGSDVKVGGSEQEIANGVVGTDGTYLSLSVQERETLEELTRLKAQGFFDRIIVLLNSALCIGVDFLNNPGIDVDACMWIGNTGMSGIYAVADAIVGDVVPSGRSSDTYVYDNFSSPAAALWKLTGGFCEKWEDASLTGSQKYYGVYLENIYVGYRYYETRYADVVENRPSVGIYDYAETVAFPFGYGLSYAEFAYSGFSVAEREENGIRSYDVSVTVTNTQSSYAGKEVVQVYLQKPYTDYAEHVMMEVPAVELVGYAKTEELAPGESQTITVNVPEEEFTSYDTYGVGSYILDSGDYFLAVGKNSHDALNNILAYKGYSAMDGMDTEGEANLVWHKNFAQQDTLTYTFSAETGKKISNALAEIDPDRYTGSVDTVTYVSRSNWEETYPGAEAVITLTDTILSDLGNIEISDVESVGSLPEYGADNGLTLANLRGKEFGDPSWNLLLDQMTFEEQNELISLAVNTVAVESVLKPATKESDGPTYVKDVGPEGEPVSAGRLPCEGIWASTFNDELARAAGELLANGAIVADVDGLWTCGVNIHRTPFGGRAHEYFSEDPFLTGNMAESEIRGLQNYGIIPGVKHFAFNDQEEHRNGVGTWLNEQSAREIYLEPWKYVASPSKGNSYSVMTSFNRMGTQWTSASAALITEILRGEFGFEGYVITDSAAGNGSSYMATLDGILAGTDCWLNYNSGTHSFVQYKNNATVANAMREACHRILFAICNHSVAMNGISDQSRIVKNFVWYEFGLHVVTAVIAACVLCFITVYILTKYRPGAKDRSHHGKK